MRCTACHSYIPEGLPAPVTCPQCGRVAGDNRDAPTRTDRATIDPPPYSTSPKEAAPEAPFAPYFTVCTRLVFGLAASRLSTSAAPSDGSISFGPEGFSIVWGDGGHWEKLLYRDLSDVRLSGDSVCLSIRDAESKLAFFSRSSFFRRPSKKKAVVFIDLMGKVRNGLTPDEIRRFQQELE